MSVEISQKSEEIITNEVSSSELTVIVDSSECLNDFSPDCSAEGLKYLAGYIAHKYRKYDRSLAIPSGQSLAVSSKEKTWIEVLSRGGLLIPTDEWFEQIKKFEETFIEMHDKKNNFETVSLSRKSVTSRIEAINKNLTSQLESKIGQFKFCSIAIDKSTDINDAAQLVLLIRGVDENFEITEELACIRSLKGTTKGCDIFREFQERFLNLKVPITNICNITTDGAPNMSGKKSGFLGLFNQNYPVLCCFSTLC
ncbi:unnamed protein product [Larinioides sclopetarius]|uniref:General transcription factor II-I repeat domain-containing protein 2 n=1 Tax=Larinioides sclopetarius TaxID=280406 RepID=A0AAV2A868_9ARAC